MNQRSVEVSANGLPPTISCLRGKPSRQSLIILPDIGGSVFYSRKILKYLPTGQSVFGLGLDDTLFNALPECTLNDLAVRFAADLCASSLPGPYHLAGHSFAGFLAYETARELVRREAPVGSLTLLDSALPYMLRRHETGAWYRHGVERLRHMRRRLRYPGKLRQTGRPEDENTEFLSVPGYLYIDLTKFTERYGYIIRHLYRMMLDYRPGQYSGKVTLFRAGKQAASGEFGDLGWGQYVFGPLEVLHVPCDHLDMVRSDEAARSVADAMTLKLKTPQPDHACDATAARRIFSEDDHRNE